MGMNLILTIAGALLIGGLVAVLVVIVVKSARDKDPETKYRGQLDAILNGSDEYEGDDYELSTGNKNSIFRKWNESWGANLAEVSDQFSADDPKGGIFAAVGWLIVAILVTVFFASPFAGIALASILLSIAHIALKVRASRKDDIIRNQLTGFLFSMKANISAGVTEERTLMKVIDNMPSPLYEELLPAKSQILSNVGFSEAMANLRDETTSDDLRFLCSCMIQATATGVSLENQIDIILDSVEKTKRTNEEITQSTKAANMSMYGAAIIIPAGFIGIYLLDERARDYWFVEPMSWLALGVAGLIAFVGVRQARKFVAKVREL